VRFDPTPPANSAPPRPLTPPRTDTLAWTIQVAAFGGLPAALDLADQLTSSGAAAFVTPVSSGRGTIWYRVLAGFYRTRDAAAAARNGLWARGALKRGEGDLLLAPYSLALAPTTDIAALRALGVPAVRLPANGPPLVGAFESPEQATLAETRLQRAGVRTTLVTRTETTP
jgi:cell division protein FtsN